MKTPAALLCFLVAGAALAQPAAPAAPSDEPTPQETSGVVKEGPLRLKGFDVELSITNSSGVYFGAEGYTNSLSFSIDPSFAIGRRFFDGRWLAPLSVGAHLPIEAELTGVDPRFRGRGFTTASLYDNPQQVAIAQAQVPPPGQVSGLTQQAVLLGDLWLGVNHSDLGTLPVVGIKFGANLRAVLPTSTASRNAGLYSAISLGLNADRTFGPVTVGYSVRPTKYFFSRTSPAIIPLSQTVLVNGREEPVWRPASTGVNNPNWGLVHGASVGVELPKGFSVSVSYLLLHTAPIATSTCLVEGTPGANTCRDGVLVGDARGNALRNDHWFTAEVAWAPKFATVALGLSTYRPLRATDGGLSQPFAVSDRNNYSTLYLSITAGAEQLASALMEHRP